MASGHDPRRPEMADRMLLVSWGMVVRGREERALEVFNQSLGIYGRLQQEDRIESFDVKLMSPNAGMNGYAELKGSASQMAAVREDAEFRQMCTDAALIVDDFVVTEGYCDEGVAEQIAYFQEAIAKVPQSV
jgi:hypothetical protein